MSDEPLGGVGQTMVGDSAARERASTLFVELGDKLEAERRAVSERVDPAIKTAYLIACDGDAKTASTIYAWISEQFRKAGFHGAADLYARQAKECRRKRRTGK